MLDTWRGMLTPRRVAVLTRHLPSDSATNTALRGHVEWSVDQQLLAIIADRVAVANWQRSKDGRDGRNFPKPLPRPGVVDPNETRFGSGSWSVEEMRAKLDAWPGRKRLPTSEE